MEKLNKLYTYLGIVIMLIVGAAGIVYLSQSAATPLSTVGSVTVGNEYSSTSTPTGLGAWTDGLIREGWGSLGSVVVTKAGDTEYVLYDATSTRGIATSQGGVGSSTAQLFRVSENLVAGTYVLDVTYNRGLLLEVERGTTGTSTITFR